APERFHVELLQEALDALRRDDRQAVGLLPARGDLRQELVGRHACRGRQACFILYGFFYPDGDIARQRHAPQVLGHVEIGLVERERLDQRGRRMQDLHHPLGRLAIFLEVRPDDDELRAEAYRARHRHRRAHAERARLVACRRDHAARLGRSAHHHRLAAQLRVIAHLHRRVERVHVDVDDAARRFAQFKCVVRNRRRAASALSRVEANCGLTLTSCRNAGRPMASSSQSVCAVALASRADSLTSAASPNTPPGPSISTMRPSIDTATSPSRTAYMRMPVWPLAMICAPWRKKIGGSSARSATSSCSCFRSKTIASSKSSSCESAPDTESWAMVSRRRRISMLISISAKAGLCASAASNSSGSRAMTRQSPFATAPALRGAWAMTAISPKISPALTVPIGFFFARSSTSPLSSRYILLLRSSGMARSLSLKIFAPSAKVSGLPADLKKSSATAGS